MEILDIFEFGIFFYEDGIIVDLIFRRTDRIHEIHSVVKINKNDDKNGGKDDFEDDINNFKSFCKFLRIFELFFEGEKAKNSGKTERDGDQNSEVFNRQDGKHGENNTNKSGTENINKESD